jgi:hypothetical protein
MTRIVRSFIDAQSWVLQGDRVLGFWENSFEGVLGGCKKI